MQIPTITDVRKKIYPLVNKIIKTGEPIQFTSKGYVLKIELQKKPDKLANLRNRDAIVGDPEELVDLKVWEWNEPKNL